MDSGHQLSRKNEELLKSGRQSKRKPDKPLPDNNHYYLQPVYTTTVYS